MQTIKEYIANELFNACSIPVSCPKFNDAEMKATRILEEGIKAGSGDAERVKTTIGTTNTVAKCSVDDANEIAAAIVDCPAARMMVVITHPMGFKRYGHVTVSDLDAMRRLGIIQLI